MKLRANQLGDHLAGTLAPVYVITGDEPLQAGEAADAVRAAARARGHATREVFVVESGFDWNALQASADTLSLFADRRLIELRVPTGKVGAEGGKALVRYVERPPADTVLLVLLPKLEPEQKKSAWLRALDEAGVLVEVWPIEPGQLPGWIRQRLRRKGLQVSDAGCQQLAERVEGNLLAAAQEIEKLALTHPPGALDDDAVAAAVADSARYDVFGLAEAVVTGDGARAQRILETLRGEGEGAVLALWAVARELRTLAQAAEMMRGGKSEDAAWAELRVWDKRKPALRRGLQRLQLGRLYGLLLACARADGAVKGFGPMPPWQALRELCADACDLRLGTPGRPG